MDQPNNDEHMNALLKRFIRGFLDLTTDDICAEDCITLREDYLDQAMERLQSVADEIQSSRAPISVTAYRGKQCTHPFQGYAEIHIHYYSHGNRAEAKCSFYEAIERRLERHARPAAVHPAPKRSGEGGVHLNLRLDVPCSWSDKINARDMVRFGQDGTAENQYGRKN